MAGIYGSGTSSYRINRLDPNITQVTTQGFAPEVIKLAGSLTKQRAKAGIGVAKAPDPGLIGRIFDLVQRPLYASANVVQNLQGGEGNQSDNPLEAAWRGISGQDKTTYDKVLEDAGMGGGWQRSLASFGMDVALDPSSYVGVGIIKDGAEGVAKKLATETALASVEKGTVKKEVENLASKIVEENTVKGGETAISKINRRSAMGKLADATDAEIVHAAQTSSPIPGKVYKQTRTVGRKEAVALAKEEVHGNLAAKIMEAQDAGIAANRGKVALKFLGRETPIASKGLYSIGRGASSLARKSEFLQAANRAFRPEAWLRQGTHDILREVMGHSHAEGEQTVKEIGKLFGNKVVTMADGSKWGGLSQTQREMIPHFIESGDDLSSHLVEGTGRTLEEYKQAAMKVYDNIAQSEEILGMRSKESIMPNYVNHVFRGGRNIDQTAFRDARKSVIRKMQKEVETAQREGRSVATIERTAAPAGHTLEDAKVAGLNPEEDIRVLLGHEAVKSFQNQGQARWWHGVDLEHGIHLSQEAKGLKRKDIEALGNKLGLEKVSSPHFTEGSAWFHPEVADTLRNSQRYFGDPKGAGAELLRFYDKVQNFWKLEMTALNPSHHIRNFVGDVFLNLMDGVKNPLRYLESAQVLRNWEMNPNAIKLRVGNRVLNAKQMMMEFTRNGGKSGFFRNELAESGVRPIEWIRQMAEHREDWTRMAHFIDVMKKEGRGMKSLDDLKRVSRVAGKKVRKFNIDYGDMTPFERKIMKRVVPFYTWIRKNLPLQLETLALDPSKVGLIPKSLRAVIGATGQQQDDTLFGLNLTPKWLREMAAVRIAGEGQGRNATYWNPRVFPTFDIQQYLGGGPQEIIRSALGTTSPFIRTPIELGLERSLMTGGPVGDTGMGYAQQGFLPPTVNRGWDIVRGQADATDWAKLFGLDFQNVGPQQQMGELRRQQDPIQALLAARNRQPRSWER